MAASKKRSIQELKNDNQSFSDFVKKLAQEISWVKEGAIKRFFDGQVDSSDAFLKKLLFLSLLNEDDIRLVSQNGIGKGVFFIEKLATLGRLDEKKFADFLCTLDGFPLCEKVKGTFAQYLLDNELMSYGDLMEVMNEEATSMRRIEEIIVHKSIMTPNQIYRAMAEFISVPFIAKMDLNLPDKDLKKFPVEFFELFELIPIGIEGKKLVVSSYLPPSNLAIEALEKETKRKVDFLLCTKEEFFKRRNQFVSLRNKVVKSVTGGKKVTLKGRYKLFEKSLDLKKEDAVEMVANLIQKAVDYRATDIHLEPRRNGMNIRYRVDGFLYEIAKIEDQLGREIISRIKILADMDITERRLPQDGHFRFGTGKAEYDMRLATVPTNFGERMEIRLAEGGKVFTSVEQLGIVDKDAQLVESFISRPHGIVLATGPVGSGKTTTLYSCITKVDQDALNVMTIEDPIEYIIPGANQIEVNYKVNFGFVQGLRAILRQDPNVILVGEIRDDETAKIAIRAGMTGMLVLSTLHANDAVGSVTTMSNFGINRFLIANALVGALAQRLVRKNCPYCSVPIKGAESGKDALPVSEKELKEFKFHKGQGCERCFYTGYLGRTGIFEIFNVTKANRKLIMGESPEEAIRELALKEGLVPLKSAGIEKVKNGEITVEEYLRVLG